MPWRPRGAYVRRMTILADNIRKLGQRFDRQEEFADAVGTTQGMVSRWMSPVKPSEPKSDKLLALAELAGVTVSTLVNVPFDEWGTKGKAYLPSDDELAFMIARAQRQVPVGLTFEEYAAEVAKRLRPDLLKKLRGESEAG